MKQDRLEELIQRYIDQRLQPAERSELEDALKDSAEARREFWDHLQFESLIEEAAEAGSIAQWMTHTERATADKHNPQSLRAPRHGIWHWWTDLTTRHPALSAAAVIGVVLLALAPVAFNRARTVTTPFAEPTSNGVAVLASAWDARWEDGQKPIARGAMLPPGRIRLATGLLGIEFYNGVRMTLEGPADIELRSVREALCHSGRLRVHVPPMTRNFRVLTPTLDVLDLGTEFGLEVGPEVRTEVHVFEGKVVWSTREPGAPAGDRSELNAGEGIRIDSRGFSRIAAQPEVFVSRSQLESRMREAINERFSRWEERVRSLRTDPALVLFYDFNEASSDHRALPNLASNPGPGPDGVIVGCDWSDGRWPGRTALEFRQPSDRVRVTVPGEFESLTYVAWLRVDRIDRIFTSIFLTDLFEPGEPHWQIRNGRVRLGIGDDLKRVGRRKVAEGVEVAETGVDYDADIIFTDTDLGQWRQLAVVMDGASGEVRHFLDGRLVNRAEMVVRQKLRIGNAELGNWGLPESTDPQPIRNFSGRLDEFMIFRAALTPEEIRMLFEDGRPAAASFASVFANHD